LDAIKGLLAAGLFGFLGLPCALAASVEQPIYCAGPFADDPHASPRFRSPPVDNFSGVLPIRDYLEYAVNCANRITLPPITSAAPQSEWLSSEHRLYAQILARHPVDVLVVPLQVQGFGLDRIERALMSVDLSYALGTQSALNVADPFLVSRALGEGMRRFDLETVHQLAEQLGARYILTGYVGHDRHHNFTLTLQVTEVRPAGATSKVATPWQRDWRSVPFTDEQTPALVLHRMLPEILRALPLPKNATQAAAARNPWPKAITVTGDLRHLNGMQPSAVPPVAALALLGSLSPAGIELSRERFFERAWIAGAYDGDESDSACFFRAYVLMQLTRRPAALAALKGLSTPQANTLRALLDGDLPAAKHALISVSDSLERLLLQLNVRDLEGTYGRKLRTQPLATAAVFPKFRDQWQWLVRARAAATDPWGRADPTIPKTLLDQTFPIGGLDLRSLVEGNAAAHGEIPDEVALDLASVRHVRRATEQLQPPSCCYSASLAAGSWDALWLIEALGQARIVNSLEKLIRLQNLMSEALQRLARYEPLLAGDPLFETVKADAQVQMLDSSPDDEHDSRDAMATRSASLAARWLPGQSHASFAALLDLGIPSPQSLFMIDAYGYDYPRQSYWPDVTLGMDKNGQQLVQLHTEALQFSTSDVTPLLKLQDGNQPGQRGALLASLGTRFQGNPQLLTARVPLPGTFSIPSDATAAVLKESLQQDPELWDNYFNLGTYILKSGGSPEEAARTLLKFPGFHQRHPQDPVAVSNWANDAGSLFYALGLTELTRPFYRIAANLNTGSDAGLCDLQRLKMFDGDYLGAARIALERSNRYSDADPYRDYLTLLHVAGKGAEAWRAFTQVRDIFDSPQVWISALVAQRMGGKNETQIRAWLLRPEIRSARFRARHFATHEALWAFSTDRMPPADLGALIEQLDGPPVARADTLNGMTEVPSLTTLDATSLVPSSHFRDGKRTALPQGTLIKSQQAFFADAYAALRHGDYNTALQRFDAMADHYRIERYPLAYFAYAAAKTGDPEKLEAYMAGFDGAPQKEIPTFDLWLGKAFFAGQRKDSDAALAALRTALRLRVFTDDRPVLTEYQYAEACEWLYHDTQDRRFIAELLDWVKKQQAVQPTMAWAYAMQYQYETPGAARTRALAMTEYLDPASPRIMKASRDERGAAKAWLDQHPPFKSSTKATSAAGSQITRADSNHVREVLTLAR
jgi:hypothetical protein